MRGCLSAPLPPGLKINDHLYYASVGTSLSVGIQPDLQGANQRTSDGYADQLFDILAAGCIVGTDVNFPCIFGALDEIANNLPVIL